ncbi:GNAT family N-acetyltransferase [Marinomonas sp. C2222]|uniref:GNAT family N-acetyltransferase n=1 Tax=Marinomonas sargassi TaxID=2984494 RepID=A0ABT2YQ31_9GAMM|nr:N-acetyltransferase [Marinomonas sargassi]MCV2401989.1 GNAT family N-acetyltransferase [Marinomonas sargassi]
MITIREASIEDLNAVVAIFEQYRSFYQQESNLIGATDFIRSHIEKGESTIFIAESSDENTTEGKNIAGFVQLYPLFSSTGMKKLWLLNDLFVDANYRKQGIAEQLITAARELAVRTSARGLMLETSASNLPAQALYEKVGFTKSQSVYYELDI